MDSHELLSKMFDECANHLNSLEVYEDFPDVSRQAVDDTKALIQAMLRKLAKSERLLTPRAADEGYAPLEDHDPTADIERISKEGFPKSLRR